MENAVTQNLLPIEEWSGSDWELYFKNVCIKAKGIDQNPWDILAATVKAAIESASEPKIDRNRPIEDLCLSTRSYNALRRANFCTIDEIASLRYSELQGIRMIGHKGAKEIAIKLNQIGIRVRGSEK